MDTQLSWRLAVEGYSSSTRRYGTLLHCTNHQRLILYTYTWLSYLKRVHNTSDTTTPISENRIHNTTANSRTFTKPMSVSIDIYRRL
jgi:hypothetical protein